MKRAEVWARSKGATSIELTVYAFNQRAQHSNRGLGYENLGRKMSRSLGRPEPENGR